MSALQLTGIVLCMVIPTIGWALLFRQGYRFYRSYAVGRPDPTRTDQPGARTMTLLKEFLGHTRMARLPLVAIAHWFVALSFLILFSTLVNAFLQLFDAEARLPIVGHFPPFEWLVELFTWGGFIGILYLIFARQKAHPRSAEGEQGRRSRFFGSTWWQAYFVEIIILTVCICILSLRTQEAALLKLTHPGESIGLHFPLTGWLSGIWGGLSERWLRESIYVVATIKILVSFTWMITVALQPTMGVAWHRFLAFFNIWFKRKADGGTALGALQPMRIDGKPVTLETIEAMGEAEDEEEDAVPAFGVGKVEDFTWKQLLDFSTCTECGRCQSQCPAWNTDKPLSPKLLMMTLRNHADAKQPLLQTADRSGLPEHTRALREVPLVGETGYDITRPLSAYDPLGPSAVIDEDVLWSCTSCGACVEQCPVDIEHVDAIVDMRRHQVLIESAFPQELGGLFKNMESKGNPWGMAPRARLDWAKDLPFSVPVVGQDVESLDEVDYLFWVGCAGAYEDRAKKTSRAVAELLNTAGVKFAVLGNGETCTGDSARRAGNEILFQMLAAQNVATLNEANAKTIIVTCAHCFNTLKNEYPQVGGEYTVLHHTQVLNKLVREQRLTPVARPGATPIASTAKDVSSSAASVTYHDPCYLGRHNNVYAPPRELIGALPGVELREMPRHGEKSFCCGAGGARMWMEEKLGTRINVNRTQEAVATGADRIAVGCPFCRVMISDGLTAEVSEGRAREEVEVVDIAQMLLAAVREPKAAEPQAAAAPAEDLPASPEQKTPAEEAPVAAAAGATAVAAAAATAAGPAEDSAVGDPWDDEPAAAAPAASAPAAAAPAAPAADVEDPWDDDAPAAPAASAPAPAAPAAPATDVADPWDDEPAAAAPAASAPAPAAPAAPAADVADPWDDEPVAAAAASAPAAAAPAAPAAPASEVADPWDDEAPAAPAANAPAPAAPVAPASEVADPWDDDAPAAPAAASAPATAMPAPQAAPASEAKDPWDDDEDTTPVAEAPVASAPAATAPTPAAAPASEVKDPWDDDTTPAAPAAPAASTPAPAAPAPATQAASVSEVKDPWDDDEDTTPVAEPTPASATPAPASEAPQPEAPAPAAESTPAPAPAEQAATPASEVKDPWDDDEDTTPVAEPTPAPEAPAAQTPPAAPAQPATPPPADEVPDPWDE